MKVLYNSLLILMISGFLFLPEHALAFDGKKPDQEKSKQNFQLESTTVTAQKKEENLQDVPLSVSVLNEQDIEDRGIEAVPDIADFVPNFMLFENGVSAMNSPAMRGVHAFVESMTVSCGLFVDGIPVLTATGYEEGLVDIERVEVLRGPQGTLYGKNTETGALNIITKQPDNDLIAKAVAEIGEDEKKLFSFNVSGPIQENKLFLSLAGQYYAKDGYIENTFRDEFVNNKENWFGRAQLRWTPLNRLDISLLASTQQFDDGDQNMTLGVIGAKAYGLPIPEEGKVASDMPGKNEATINSQALKVKYDFNENLALTSVTTRRVFNDKASQDYDFTPMKLMHSHKDSKYTKLSQELRMNASNGKFKWLVGLYADKDDKDINTFLDSVLSFMARSNNREITGDSYAIFGQASYAFTPKINFIAGLRYENQKMDFKDLIANVSYDGSWDDVSPKIAFEYRFNPQVMSYVSVAKGYRSGGFNTYATNPKYASYDGEKLWSYELGTKTTLLDKRLMLNGAVFYMDIEDMQVNESITPYEAYLTNAGQASAIGAEVDLKAKITQSVCLIGSFGYCDIKFDEFKDSKGDYKNNKNPYAPAYTYNIGAQYRGDQGFYARADLIGYGKMYFDKANKFSRDAFEIVNLKIGYEMENFDIYLYGKNVFDKEYNSYGYFDGFYTIYSDPREVGLRLVYRF